jgi:hypothetical protein
MPVQRLVNLRVAPRAIVLIGHQLSVPPGQRHDQFRTTVPIHIAGRKLGGQAKLVGRTDPRRAERPGGAHLADVRMPGHNGTAPHVRQVPTRVEPRSAHRQFVAAVVVQVGDQHRPRLLAAEREAVSKLMLRVVNHDPVIGRVTHHQIIDSVVVHVANRESFHEVRKRLRFTQRQANLGRNRQYRVFIHAVRVVHAHRGCAE